MYINNPYPEWIIYFNQMTVQINWLFILQQATTKRKTRRDINGGQVVNKN